MKRKPKGPSLNIPPVPPKKKNSPVKLRKKKGKEVYISSGVSARTFANPNELIKNRLLGFVVTSYVKRSLEVLAA